MLQDGYHGINGDPYTAVIALKITENSDEYAT